MRIEIQMQRFRDKYTEKDRATEKRQRYIDSEIDIQRYRYKDRDTEIQI